MSYFFIAVHSGRILNDLLVPGLDQLFEIMSGARSEFSKKEYMMDVITRVSTSLLTFKIPVRASKTITRIVKGVLGKTLGKMYTVFARSLIKYART